jgi:hypothetical protein
MLLFRELLGLTTVTSGKRSCNCEYSRAMLLPLKILACMHYRRYSKIISWFIIELGYGVTAMGYAFQVIALLNDVKPISWVLIQQIWNFRG